MLVIEWQLRYSSLHYKKGNENTVHELCHAAKMYPGNRNTNRRKLCDLESAEPSMYLTPGTPSHHLECLLVSHQP